MMVVCMFMGVNRFRRPRMDIASRILSEFGMAMGATEVVGPPLIALEMA
jgi:hypothetical protein